MERDELRTKIIEQIKQAKTPGESGWGIMLLILDKLDNIEGMLKQLLGGKFEGEAYSEEILNLPIDKSK